MALAGDIPDFVPASISAFHELALELIESLRGLSKAKTVLNFVDTSGANQGAPVWRKGGREVEWDELGRRQQYLVQWWRQLCDVFVKTGHIFLPNGIEFRNPFEQTCSPTLD